MVIFKKLLHTEDTFRLMAKDAPTYIDLFAGAGGLSLGLFNSGWLGLFAVEKSKMAFDTLEHNLIKKNNHFLWPEWLPIREHDIDDLLTTYYKNLLALNGKVDLIVGGPPCQGFSHAGLRKYNDKRNKLVFSYLDFIRTVNPSVIFLENVKGFTSSFKSEDKRGKKYFDYVREALRSLNYEISYRIVDFNEFGVPQKRNRFLLVGSKERNSDLFFKSLYEKRGNFLERRDLKKTHTLGEAISDLEKKHGTLQPISSRFKYGVYGTIDSDYQRFFRSDWDQSYPDSHRFSNHRTGTITRSKYILEHCKRNVPIDDSVKKIFQVKKRSIIPVDKEKSCPTITTLPDDFIHYSEPRIFTVREYARIQTFPDWYEIRNNYTTGGKRRRWEVPRYSQIGNAVPPLFGEQAGFCLKELLY